MIMIRNVKHEKIKAEKGKHLRILRFRQLKGHRMEKGKDAKKSTWPLHNDKRRKEGRRPPFPARELPFEDTDEVVSGDERRRETGSDECRQGKSVEIVQVLKISFLILI